MSFRLGLHRLPSLILPDAKARRGLGSVCAKNILRNKNGVDDVDDTVARRDVGLDNIRAPNGHLAGIHFDRQLFAIQGLGIGRLNIRGH